MSQEVVSNPLAYASGVRSALARGEWKVLVWFGVIHFAAFATLLALTAPGFLRLWEFLHGQPAFDWYVTGLLAHQLALPVLGLTNLLAVAGYAAGLRGGSPRPWFSVYVPTQLGLMAVSYGISVALVSGSPHAVGPSSSVGTGGLQLVLLPVGFVVVGLPLVLLLVPRIRRGCFG
jgi:hypothetical protein